MKDKLQEFEEKNWNELAEKFIDKKQEDWAQFVYDEYEKSIDFDPPDNGEER